MSEKLFEFQKQVSELQKQVSELQNQKQVSEEDDIEEEEPIEEQERHKMTWSEAVHKAMSEQPNFTGHYKILTKYIFEKGYRNKIHLE